MSVAAATTEEDPDRRLQLVERLLRVKQAKDDLITFTEVTMPDASAPEDATRTRYQAQYFHRALAAALQEVEAGRIKRLIITWPPRHGKSELASKRFPAWFIGRNPTKHLAFGTYNQEFADDFGRAIRDIMKGDAYAQVFPGVELKVDSQAANRLQTKQDGALYFVGRGGPLTGRGADCIAAGTLVATEIGPLPIEQISAVPGSPRVLGFDHSTRCVSWRRVQATREIVHGEGYRVVTRLGRQFVGTADHRVFVRDRGYTELSALRPGDGLVSAECGSWPQGPGAVDAGPVPLRAVRCADGASELRRVQSCSERAHRSVLLQDVLGAGPRGEEPKAVRTVRHAHGRPSLDVLPTLPQVQETGDPGGQAPLPRVRRVVLAAEHAARVLLSALRQRCPFQANDRGGQQPVQGRDQLLDVVPGIEAARPGTGQPLLRGLWSGRRDQGHSAAAAEQFAHPPRGRGSAQQRAGEPGGAVRGLPHDAPQVGVDTVQVVERVRGGPIRFYDIDVEGTRNFFAGEILVHNCIIIDDPLKNSEEADSATTRNSLWEWFNNDVMSRFMTDEGRAVVISTRWHMDDLVGRLTDPKNPHYNEDEARQWKVINIPALAEEDDALGRAPGEPLWPERFGLDYLLGFKRRNSRGFNALYQQRPTAEDGEFFKAEHLVEYLPDQRPPVDRLKVYMASDHAVAQKQHNDKTCILIVGVDQNDNIWVLDCYWKRAPSDQVVEKLIDMIQQWKPITWWAEDDHITKSIGPFLRKRMRERKVYLGHSKVPSYVDKQKKAQAIRGRASMGMVLFPKTASWWVDAKDELLKFPYGAHDDFVDALSTVGRGLGVLIAPAPPKTEAAGPKTGTFGWIKQSARTATRDARVRRTLASM